MKVLLLGVGMQGKATLHDLVESKGVSKVIAADVDSKGLATYVQSRNYGDKVTCEYIDASDTESIDRLMKLKADVAIDLLPPMYINDVAKSAIKYGVNLVNTMYVSPEIKELSAEAEKKGITILPEFGMDPGIDLVFMGETVRNFDQIEELYSYGAGFPEKSAADNSLKYKETWTFEGVLKSFLRAGKVIRNGEEVIIKENEMFTPENTHTLNIDTFGNLEAFPNGDATKYADILKLDKSCLKELGRYVLRWEGHCDFWRKIVDLNFLDNEPVEVEGVQVDKKKFLTALIAPQIQYKDSERDAVLVRIDTKGIKDGKKKRIILQSVDYRDLDTGFTAMSRTVGYTASIGAQMIVNGKIPKRGVISPVFDIPYEPFAEELRKRNIQTTFEVVDC